MAQEPSDSDELDAAFRELLHPQYPSALRLRDAEGRLLGEGNAPMHLVERENIEWRPSRYPGSRYRHPKPINASALKQLTRHWDAMLELVLATRSGFVRRYRLDGPLTVSRLWRFSRFSVTMPNYLSSGGVRDAEPVAPAVAVAFKSIAGIFIVAADMSLRDVDLEEILTPDEIIEYADDHGLFGGALGVCAGPPHLMRSLLQAVVSGRGAAGEAAVERVVGDAETFYRYAALYTKLEFTKQIAVCELQDRLARLDPAPAAEGATARLVANLEQQLIELEWWTPERDPPLGTVVRPPRSPEPASDDDEGRVAAAAADCAALEREALRRLSSIQRDIGDLLGRPRPSIQLGDEHVETILGSSVSRRLAQRLAVLRARGSQPRGV
ncbi:MAG: hypothetical protein M3279_09745 [Actinomycetota bacterium]|nr:hypothetical protein [Actinomycetota bacterium]